MDELKTAMLLLIRSGVTLRVLYCILRIMTGSEEAAVYKKRAFHAIVFLILAETITALLSVLRIYFF